MASVKTNFTKMLGAAVLTAGALALVVDVADARPSGGKSFGSRGSSTYSAPPPTATAPKAAAPIERSITQPGRPTAAAPGAATPGAMGAQPSRFGGWGGLLMGGLIGAGLASLFGLGAMASVLGFLLQMALIAGVIWLAWSFFRRRANPSMAGANAAGGYNTNARETMNGGQNNPRNAAGAMGGSTLRPVGKAPLNIVGDDYSAFERLLGEIQVLYGKGDIDALGSRVTPEILSYFAEELDQNGKRGIRNELGQPKLLQGDLAEAWSEGSGEYATVAMRYALTDAKVDVATGRVIEGSREQPVEVTEVWTFIRPRGGRPDQWELSAIQQVG